MRSLKIGGIIVAAFIAGAFVASPELRAYAANTVGSADIINESIQSVDIKNGQVTAADIGTGAVRAAEIAPNAVGASEIAGVDKLIFGEGCGGSSSPIAAGASVEVNCPLTGIDSSDLVLATLNGQSGSCFDLVSAGYDGVVDNITLQFINRCSSTESLDFDQVSYMLFE